MINNMNIVVIDNELDQLESIQKGFFSGGIPCLPIHYQYDLMDNQSGIDHVDLGEFAPRIVVTDLNLRASTLNTIPELVKPIADLLEKLAIKGPFILIFWSGFSEKVNSVMDILQERFYKKIPFPLYFSCIDKNKYLDSGKSDELKEKIQKIIYQNNLFNALLDWEARIYQAAKETTNSLYDLTKPNCINKGENYHTLHSDEMIRTLTAIGNEALGPKNAKNNAGIAMDSGLTPVLQDHLYNTSNTNALWKESLPNIGDFVEINDQIKPALNSFYHIENVLPDFSKNCKGVFVQISDSLLENKIKKQKLENRLGRTIDEILSEEFISTRKFDCKSKADMKRFRADAKNKSILGFVEVSADCDQAQKKTKLHRYLLAVLIPSEFKGITTFEHEGVPRETSHEGIYKTPTLLIGGKEYILKISFKYQFGTIPNSTVNDIKYENSWLGIPKFRLREQILTDIVFKCAQHAARPGIIFFQ